jgi:RNA polymerase sigma factor (sigma-70 family)
MPTSPTTSGIEHLRGTVLREGAGLGDGELLGRFLERHDEAALAALVRRHGPLVWGVCRRLLGHHDAEDAFQATFLVLVRKAASVVPRESVGNFLYGVAHQTALQARRAAARRRAREVQVTVMPDAEAVQQDQWLDVQPLLDQELSRLPDIYRPVVVLCDLEGRTRKEVARQLGVPEGTVAGRLARARAMLAKRLTERGVTLSGGVLAAVLSRNVACGGVPNSVVSSTIKAASLLAAGQAAAGGAIPVKVAALTEGVMKAMLFTKLRAALAVVLVLGFVATGATILTCRTAAGQDDKKPAAEKPVESVAKQEKEAFTAWGKEVGGLQAGLGYDPGQKRAYGLGETVRLVLRVRNVSKEAVKFEYHRTFFMEYPPAVTDGQGKRVRLTRVALSREIAPEQVNLAPGKEIELYELKFKLRPASEKKADDGDVDFGGRVSTLYGTGTFQIQYERFIAKPSAGPEPDPTLSKLATGKLELEVKDADKPPAEQEKEGFTAWGKEIGGLQAGVRLERIEVFNAAANRMEATQTPVGKIHQGSDIIFKVFVRNMGKQEVKLKYIEPSCWLYSEDGRNLKFDPFFSGSRNRFWTEKTLQPGEKWEVGQLNVTTREPKPTESFRGLRLFELGKYRVSCPSVLMQEKGNNLATGEVEIEIVSPKRE